MSRLHVKSIDRKTLDMITLDRLHMGAVGIAYLNVPFLNFTNIHDLLASRQARSALRTRSDELEKEANKDAQSIYAAVVETTLKPIYGTKIPNEGKDRVPLAFENQFQRVKTLLEGLTQSDCQLLWGRQNRKRLRDNRRVLLGDTATTMAWFFEYIHQGRSMDVSYMKEKTKTLVEAELFMAGQTLPWDVNEPAIAPYCITRRVKSKDRRMRKAFEKLCRTAFWEKILSVSGARGHGSLGVPVNDETIERHQMLAQTPEQQWPISVRRRVIDANYLRDIVGITVFYRGGQRENTRDSITKARDALLKHPMLRENYTLEAPQGHARLHRVKIRLVPQNPQLHTPAEIILVADREHFPQYEFGKDAHPEYKRRLEQGFFVSNNYIPYTRTQRSAHSLIEKGLF